MTPCTLRFRTNQYLTNDKVGPLNFFICQVHKCPALHLWGLAVRLFQGVAKQEAGTECHQLEGNAGFGAAPSRSPAMEIVFEIQLHCQAG